MKLRLLMLTVVVSAISAETGQAQISTIDAEFAGAGARALGMGTAFIAMADDASAAEFNPAGLRILRRPEVGFQVLYTDQEHEQFLFDRSFYAGDPITETFEDSYFTPSFFSIVYPTQHFVVALSELTAINLKTHFVDSVEYDPADLPFVRSERHFESQTTLRNYGLSLATALTPEFYVGGSLRYAVFSYEDSDWELTRTLGGDAITSTETDEESGAFNWNLGAIWRVHPCFSLGAVYKSTIPIDIEAKGVRQELDLPWTFGAGLAFHPNDRLRILFDWDRANWSDFVTDEDREFHYRREDVNRYHIGGEYMLGIKWDTAWFLRTGYFLEESNALFYDGPRGIYYDFLTSAAPKEDDIDHYSVGLGLARDTFQIDFAADFTEDTTDLILSTVFYF
jgi:long-chain fatty acid transport protein